MAILEHDDIEERQTKILNRKKQFGYHRPLNDGFEAKNEACVFARLCKFEEGVNKDYKVLVADE